MGGLLVHLADHTQRHPPKAGETYVHMIAMGSTEDYNVNRNGDGWKRDWLSGQHAANVFGLTVSADGKTIVYCHSKADSPSQWYHARLDKNAIQKPEAVAKINESMKNFPLAG